MPPTTRATALLLAAALAAAACGADPAPPPVPPPAATPAPPPELGPEVFPLSSAPALEHPGRDAWQRPDEVVAALHLAPGARVADVGCGTGYFTVRLLAAVGDEGRVLAVDVQQGMLDLLAARLSPAQRERVTLRCNPPERPLEAGDGMDLVFCANTLKEVPDAEAPAFVRSMADGLAPGGRLAVVDWLPERTPLGPPVAERIAPERVRELAEAAGLVLAEDLDLLEMQSFQIFRRPD